MLSAMISAVLAVTEPMALPMAMSACPLEAAMLLTISSGSVVATETIVAPTMNRGTPDTSAIHPAASTNQSPPLMMRISPRANSRMMTARDSIEPLLSCVCARMKKRLMRGSASVRMPCGT